MFMVILTKPIKDFVVGLSMTMKWLATGWARLEQMSQSLPRGGGDQRKAY
jgi:hypothetical protein